MYIFVKKCAGTVGNHVDVHNPSHHQKPHASPWQLQAAFAMLWMTTDSELGMRDTEGL